MPIRMILSDGLPRPVKIWTHDVDLKSQQQLANVAKMPFVHHHVAAMPDVHLGIGATVGSVIPTHKAIIPAAVGVDIGCGMNAVRLSIKASDLPGSLVRMRSAIEKAIPLGAGGAHKESNDAALPKGWTHIADKMGMSLDAFAKKASYQLGSLGSGNHFIEVCLDENEDVWVMLHSGSRGIGNMIGRTYIDKAKALMEKFQISLPDGDLAYFPEGTDEFADYVDAINWAQDYALENRRQMMVRVLLAMRAEITKPFDTTMEAINCHHNYVSKENHFGANVYVTRKGAIRAREGELGIIPGSMGAKSFIVRGKGNLESFCSCSHGAGRRLSRTAAEKQFTVADLKAQTEGIECRKDASVLDEIPGAYKPIDEVMDNQSDLVEIVHTLRQVLNVKG